MGNDFGEPITNKSLCVCVCVSVSVLVSVFICLCDVYLCVCMSVCLWCLCMTVYTHAHTWLCIVICQNLLQPGYRFLIAIHGHNTNVLCTHLLCHKAYTCSKQTPFEQQSNFCWFLVFWFSSTAQGENNLVLASYSKFKFCSMWHERYCTPSLQHVRYLTNQKCLCVFLSSKDSKPQ